MTVLEMLALQLMTPMHQAMLQLGQLRARMRGQVPLPTSGVNQVMLQVEYLQMPVASCHAGPKMAWPGWQSFLPAAQRGCVCDALVLVHP